MTDTEEMKPSRLRASITMAEAFIADYFDQNPLSQMGVIISYNSVAEKLSEMSGNS